MPWANIVLTPGLNVEITPTINHAGYSATQLVRFKSGLAQKMGGWTKYFSSNVSGLPRATHAWQDLAGNHRLAIGTTTGLFDITNSAYSAVSQQTLTTNPAVNFATTLGSAIVTIVDSAVNAITPYDVVYIETPISVGGLILAGPYQVESYVSSTSYTITAATTATSTVASPGGAVPTFTTTNGSANVSVGLVAHGLVAGNDVIFPIATTVGGVTISGRYIVQSVTSADIFVITASNSATSGVGPTSMNGGNAGFVYYIAIGPQASSGTYGAGTYGDGVYGLGTTITGQVGAAPTNTDWCMDNWGELLISNPENGGIYYWGPNSGYLNSSIVPTAPFFNTGAFVSIAQQMIIAYGSTVSAGIGYYQDPLLVRWCDSEDFFTWTGTINNQAGSYRIPTGSKIISGAATSQQNLIWTDQDCWAMTYIGSSLVFGFNKVGSNCGIIAKHAKAQLSGNTYWMGTNNFFVLSGSGVQPVPCPVWDAVFQDLDTANAHLCHAGSNTSFSEVIFLFPSLSGGLGYCDKYAKLNVAEGTWDIGSLQRNTWGDSSVVGFPIATTNSGTIYSHESGYDADGSPLNYSYETGWTYIDGGREISFIDRIYPDFKWGLYGGSQNASILVTIKTVNYPGETPISYGPYTVNQATQFISKRFRARQISFKFEGNDMGSFSRLGLVRVRYSPDGRGQ
jgi:hypothetical protein